MGQSCSSNNELGPEESSVPHFKIILIGPPNSGKTCLLERYIHNRYSPDYKATDRAQIVKDTKGVNLPDYGLVSLTFWDCPGEEDIDLRGTYYRDTDAVIIAADLSQEDSLEIAVQWKEDFFRIGTETIHNYLKVEGVWVDSPTCQPISDIIPVILLGTKYDLVWSGDDNTAILRSLDKFCESHGFKAGIPVTSRWNDGSVLRAFQTIARLLLDRRNRGDQDEEDVKVETALAGPGDAEAGLQTKGGPPDYGLFLHTNSKNVEELFERANPCYARILEWQYHFTREVRKMRQYCGQAGISNLETEENESWDTVLVTLKHAIASEFGEVKVVEDELTGQIQIEGKDMTGAEIPAAYDAEDSDDEEETKAAVKEKGEEIEENRSSKDKKSEVGSQSGLKESELTAKQKIYVVMTHFNIKLAPVLRIITSDGNLLLDFLKSLDSRIVKEVTETDPNVIQINVDAVEENRIRLTQLEFQIQELVEMVNTFVKKVRFIMS